jgi:uncharacterized RDD family membrane protein YckC
MSSPEKRLWWYVEDEDSWGPVTQDALRDIVASGRLGHSFLVWSPGLADWVPINGVGELAEIFQPPPVPTNEHRWSAWSPEQQTTTFNVIADDVHRPAEATPPAAAAVADSGSRAPSPPQAAQRPEPEGQLDAQTLENAAQEPAIVIVDYSDRILPAAALPPSPVAPMEPAGPWRRFFARAFDLQWDIYVTAAVAWWLLPPEFWARPYASLAFVFGTIPLALLVDALVSATFGTTPGKALLGIRIVNLHSEPLGGFECLSRNAALWVQGLGLGVPPLTLITLYVALQKVRGKNSTAWDRAAGHRVLHQPKPAVSAFVFAVIWLALSAGGSVVLEHAIKTGAAMASGLHIPALKPG